MGFDIRDINGIFTTLVKYQGNIVMMVLALLQLVCFEQDPGRQLQNGVTGIAIPKILLRSFSTFGRAGSFQLQVTYQPCGVKISCVKVIYLLIALIGSSSGLTSPPPTLPARSSTSNHHIHSSLSRLNIKLFLLESIQGFLWKLFGKNCCHFLFPYKAWTGKRLFRH